MKPFEKNGGTPVLVAYRNENVNIVKCELKMKSRQVKDLQDKNHKEKGTSFELRFYSGYKRSETPRAVVIGNKEFKIQEIIWRKRVFDQKTKKTVEVFKCRMEGEIVKITIYESGEWAISFSEET